MIFAPRLKRLIIRYPSKREPTENSSYSENAKRLGCRIGKFRSEYLGVLNFDSCSDCLFLSVCSLNRGQLKK